MGYASKPYNLVLGGRALKCARVDHLPVFPYNRGWANQPNTRGLYTHYKDSLLKVGGLPSPIQGVDRPWLP